VRAARGRGDGSLRADGGDGEGGRPPCLRLGPAADRGRAWRRAVAGAGLLLRARARARTRRSRRPLRRDSRLEQV